MPASTNFPEKSSHLGCSDSREHTYTATGSSATAHAGIAKSDSSISSFPGEWLFSMRFLEKIAGSERKEIRRIICQGRQTVPLPSIAARGARKSPGTKRGLEFGPANLV